MCIAHCLWCWCWIVSILLFAQPKKTATNSVHRTRPVSFGIELAGRSVSANTHAFVKVFYVSNKSWSGNAEYVFQIASKSLTKSGINRLKSFAAVLRREESASLVSHILIYSIASNQKLEYVCLCRCGTYLRKNSVYSACRMRPVRIMIVWKHCRSIAHNLQSVLAVIVAVRWQLYKMANSPSTLAPDNVDKYFPSRETSTRPSEKFEKERQKQINFRVSLCFVVKLISIVCGNHMIADISLDSL